jgi:hypothetical protein
MQLIIHSDASHLGDSESRSRAGGLQFLGDLQESHITNGSIICISNLIPTICAAVTESEYAATFINAREAEALRGTLTDLGYPQPATIIICDNSCAVGITNATMKHRMTKAIAMRYHWIRDRVAQGHFLVKWQPGEDNLADYFTKAYTGKATNEIRKVYVHSPQLAYLRDNARTRRIKRMNQDENFSNATPS